MRSRRRRRPREELGPLNSTKPQTWLQLPRWNLLGFLHLTWNVTLTVLRGIWDVPPEGSGGGAGGGVGVGGGSGWSWGCGGYDGLASRSTQRSDPATREGAGVPRVQG